MKIQKGFTLIELVVVIVILGILAAVALPRFTNLQTDATIAKVRSLEGNMRSAAAMFVGQSRTRAGQGPIAGCTLNANGAGGVASLGTPGRCVTAANFYPTANLAGIAAVALDIPTAGWPPTNADLQAAGYSFAGGAIQVRTAAGAFSNQCQVAYTAATATNPPVFTTTITGC